jgi:hypothetical protein
MQATAFPYAGSQAIVPLLEMALAQTNGNGAYVYAFDPGEPFARLAAWAGLAPTDADWRNLKTPSHFLQRATAVVLHQRASDDWRFENLQEFRKFRFSGVVSIPLLDAGELVGVANFCRTLAAPLPPRELSFLLTLSLPLGALLNGEAVRERLERTTQLLANRKVLARAKGVLQAKLGWTEEEANLHLRRLSRQNGTPLREIAREVIQAVQEGQPDGR